MSDHALRVCHCCGRSLEDQPATSPCPRCLSPGPPALAIAMTVGDADLARMADAHRRSYELALARGHVRRIA